MSLLVVGTLGIDHIETPFDSRPQSLGGSATYISLAASYFLQSGVSIVGVVGEDFPQRGWDLFKSRNIDTSGIDVIAGGKTFAWHGKYHYDMNTRDSLSTDLNVLAQFSPKIPASLPNPDFVVLGNVDPTLQRQVVEQLTTKPKLILCDTMDFWINGMRSELEKTLALSDALVLNDSEARLLVDHPSLIQCGRRLQKMLCPSGPHMVVIKKGEHGAILFYGDHLFIAPAYPLEEIYDPTGAGDTFMGGFIGYLARHNELNYDIVRRAIIFGTVLASYCCSKFSTEGIEDIPMSAIFERFRELQMLTAFTEELQAA